MCRYVEQMTELREIFCTLHLAEMQPDAIIVDGPQFLRSGVTDSPSPHGIVKPSSRTLQCSPQQPSPAMHREAQRNDRMQIACALALSAHAADGLPRSCAHADASQPGSADAVLQQPLSRPPLYELCIGCVDRLLDPEVSSRWLSEEVTVRLRLGIGSHPEYSISSRPQAGKEGPLATFGVVDRRLVVHGARSELTGAAVSGNGYSPPPKGLAGQPLLTTVPVS